MPKKDTGQSTPKYTTADEQNALRRASKARKKTNRSRGGSTATTSLFDEINQDRHTQQKALAQERQQMAGHQFRQDQAARALTLLELRGNPLSEKVARAIIAHFPDISFDPNKVSRTRAAIIRTKTQLTSEERRDFNAVQAGVVMAQAALINAYNKLKAASAHDESTALINA